MDIKEIINLRYAMPDASLDKLRQCLTEVSYPKGFRVLESGKVEKDIFFIKKGIVRAYTSVDGKDITFWVGKEGATLVSMKGYVNDEPGYETMELMEDSVLYVLERKKLKELFLKDLHIANWGRRYAEMELLAAEERQDSGTNKMTFQLTEDSKRFWSAPNTNLLFFRWYFASVLAASSFSDLMSFRTSSSCLSACCCSFCNCRTLASSSPVFRFRSR